MLRKYSDYGHDKDAKDTIDQLFYTDTASRKTEGPRRRLKVPELPEQNKQQELVSKSHAEKELRIIYDAYKTFREETEKTMLFGYLQGESEQFLDALRDLEQLLLEDVDEKAVTSRGAGDLQRLRKIRNRILHDLEGRYKDGK